MKLEQTKKSLNPSFPFWLKRWRAYLNATQKEFAKLWGVSASMVQKIETGDYELGQLSFERLELLRNLMEMTSSEFYGILTENKPAEDDAYESENIVTISYLDNDESYVSLPAVLLKNVRSNHLYALDITNQMFASDRLRYSLPVGTTIVIDEGTKVKKGDIALARFGADTVLFPYGQENIFLRPYNPKDQRALELIEDSKLEFLGIYVAAWISKGLTQ